MESMGLSPPQARDEGLLTRELPDGMMVYDKSRQQAHSLNRTAALVWRHCDGKTAVPEIAARLHQELSLPADEELVWLALDRLEKAHLLQTGLVRPTDMPRTTRRAVIRKLGLAGGLVAFLPLVDSLVAPKPADADSAGGGGAPCFLAIGNGNGTNFCGTCKQTGSHSTCVGPPVAGNCHELDVCEPNPT
jgi:hypothetical protein